MNTERRHYQAYDPGIEVKAYVYQQLQDLEPLIKPIGNVTVMIEQIVCEKTEEEHYSVSFVLEPNVTGMEFRAEGENIYEACLAAKELTIKKVNQFLNSNTPDVDGFINEKDLAKRRLH